MSPWSTQRLARKLIKQSGGGDRTDWPTFPYVLTSHFPQKLLTPLLAIGQAVASQHDTVYDLTISTLKPVRFIICSRTDNPVLALFSDKIERVIAAYTTIEREPTLFADVSIYWKQVLRQFGKEIPNMYTKEDFLRDYPPATKIPGSSPCSRNWPRKNCNRALNKASIGHSPRS